MEKYQVYMNNEIVGTAELTALALYYQIRCSCAVREGVYRLYDRCDRGCIPIGLCIPDRDCIRLDKNVPIKKLGQGSHYFYLESKTGNSDKQMRIMADAPVESLLDLESAKLRVIDAVPVLIFPNG